MLSGILLLHRRLQAHYHMFGTSYNGVLRLRSNVFRAYYTRWRLLGRFRFIPPLLKPLLLLLLLLLLPLLLLLLLLPPLLLPLLIR